MLIVEAVYVVRWGKGHELRVPRPDLEAVIRTLIFNGVQKFSAEKDRSNQ